MDWEKYRDELDRVTAPQAAVDGLMARVGRRRSAGWRRWTAALAAACLLVCAAVAAARGGWLDPVVRYGQRADLIEAYSVTVGETAAGEHCDVTLENAVTDGTAIYCLFTARYDEKFLDMDEAIRYLTMGASEGWNITGQWRVDDRSQAGWAQFVAVTGMTEGEEDVLGKDVTITLSFLDDAATGVMRPVETYQFDVHLNEHIDILEHTWPDGAKLVVTPLMMRLTVDLDVPDWYLAPDGAWMERYREMLDQTELSLRFADGSTFTAEDRLDMDQRVPFLMEWLGSGEDGYQPCRVALLFPELVDPKEVAAVTMDGRTYELD